MSDKRQMPKIETSKDVNMPVSKEDEPGLPVKIPLSIVRWLIYSVCFFVFLTPFEHTIGQWACGAIIIGWFAGQLNAIANKKEGKQ
jgi:hypothetical protein